MFENTQAQIDVNEGTKEVLELSAGVLCPLQVYILRNVSLRYLHQITQYLEIYIFLPGYFAMLTLKCTNFFPSFFKM